MRTSEPKINDYDICYDYNIAKDKTEFIRITTRETGETRYYTKSDFLGGC